MSSKMWPFVALTLLLASFIFVSSCGQGQANCPVCGTTHNGSVGIINVITVPEHNPTGEPGGPFNSFDISVTDSLNHRFFVSDRIGLDVVVVDTLQNLAVNIISGDNGVAGAGDIPAPCIKDAAGNDIIPPIVTALGNFTRFGCRTAVPGGIPFHIPGFGASTHLGGFPGAQCCAARANGVNPLSAPDGEALTADGNTLFVANGSSSVVVFDLTTMNLTASPPTAPTVIADIPTGQSPDYDGCTATPCGPGGNGAGLLNPSGIAPCIASANGRAFSDPTCGDLRADEMSYDEKDHILLVANGDPALPFVTLINMSGVVARTDHCLPVDANHPYGVAYNPSTFAVTSTNPPAGPCMMGQIYYDGVGGPGAPLNPSTPVDTVVGPCPDPSNFFQNGNPVASGASGTGTAPNGVAFTIPCHHGPILTTAGAFCNQTNPATGCAGALALAGLGGSAFNPNTGHFLVTNANATGNLTVGTVDEIDPRIGNPNGPIVVNSFLMPNCMPGSIVQGPGNNFLVGCADHDGEAFPPNEYVIDGTSGAILATISMVGGVDEIWFNPGDHRYYLAARDMPSGPVLGVIDATRNFWLQNVPTNSNSHSVSVDSGLNHIFVPSQSGGPCGTQRSNGCILVYAAQ